jgi:hypothetical protein
MVALLNPIRNEPMARKSNSIRLSPAEQQDEIDRKPTAAQLAWLRCGLDQAGGKLPLFDADGQRVKERTIRSCIEQGWAEPWFNNPIKPDWLVCKLTDPGRDVVS